MATRHTLTALSLGAVVFGLAACTSTPTPTPTPSVVAATPISASSPTSTLAPSPTPSDDPVTAAVKTTIVGYYKERDLVLQSLETPPLTGLNRWATQDQVLKEFPALKNFRSTSRLEGNSVVRDIEVSSPADHGAGQEVTAKYCYDSSAARLVKPDGSIQNFDVPEFFLKAVVRLVDAKWLIASVEDTGMKCQ